MARTKKPVVKKKIETLTHEDASRKNIPTAEYEPILHEKDKSPIRVVYERRNRDLDPQLVWRSKDEQDWSDLVVYALPLYIQEKVHPKVLIDDLRRQTEQMETEVEYQDQRVIGDLFADFNGLPDETIKTEFYQHDAHWSNRMILGDSLQVMASLTEREGLRGKIQSIYIDPPYGIKFNSNFQWSTRTNKVQDGALDQITREPEQVKAFRDTWNDGIHSYLTYLRDRLTVTRDLLADSGSVFVQISDENTHRVRCLLDEVFGDKNFVSCIVYVTTSSQTSSFLPTVSDNILWYAKDRAKLKYRSLFEEKEIGGDGTSKYNKVRYKDLREGLLKSVDNSKPHRVYRVDTITSQGGGDGSKFPVQFQGRENFPRKGGWKTNKSGFDNLIKANRVCREGKSIGYIRYLDDFLAYPRNNVWADYASVQSRSDPKVYVVQSATKIIERCILMSSDPGDLVLDPTCGAGTTAYVAEQWGRRWITIDTSRVALTLARSRIMAARYPYYLLADSKDGAQKEAEIMHTAPSIKLATDNISYGFVYERIPHITLKSIANNAEIDVIWDKYQEKIETLRKTINRGHKKSWEQWEIPIEAGAQWSDNTKQAHRAWWESRIERQKEIDASIATKADFEYFYDKPYKDEKKARVAGPFTVESLSPHRALVVGAEDELIDPTHHKDKFEDDNKFVQIILENLKIAGVQQAHKNDKINFQSLMLWPGDLVCAEGVYIDKSKVKKRAAIFIGPEFGTVSRSDLVSAAREAADAGFDVLIACAFNYDAHSTEFEKLGRVPVLKARMNADLHMADDLKNTGKGNLFVIFGEPDINIFDVEDNKIKVKINGVDVFHPNTGEVRSDGADGIACWFIDTDYNEESFFIRQAYFLGANDPYKSLKTTLKSEINREVWETLNSDISRPFGKPKNGRIAVKVINHFGDEVMKVYKV